MVVDSIPAVVLRMPAEVAAAGNILLLAAVDTLRTVAAVGTGHILAVVVVLRILVEVLRLRSTVWREEGCQRRGQY